MTAPQQQTQQPAVTEQTVAVALYQAQTPQQVSHVLTVLLLLDAPAAARLVTIVWPPNGTVAAPWRIVPRVDAALYQAAYVINAADRIRAALNAGQALDEALAAESRYAEQHRAAQQARAAAMVQVRKAKRQYGRLLGWYAHRDDRTTPACRIADGKNFNAATGPWPGTAHGGTCRCTPGKAHNTAQMVTAAWVRAGLGEHAEGAA